MSGRNPAASGMPSFAPWPAFDDKGDVDSDDTLNDSSLAQWNMEQYGVDDVSDLSDEQLTALRSKRANELRSVRFFVWLFLVLTHSRHQPFTHLFFSLSCFFLFVWFNPFVFGFPSTRYWLLTIDL